METENRTNLIRRKQQEMRALKGLYTYSDRYGERWMNPMKWAEYKKLRDEVKALEMQMEGKSK